MKRIFFARLHDLFLDEVVSHDISLNLTVEFTTNILIEGIKQVP